ncbi:hypothetical protein CKQ90_26995 [Klebsiella pneumoniae]|nr:hypothetical protein CKQ90_26995 [Klebsiella pneumoniae]
MSGPGKTLFSRPGTTSVIRCPAQTPGGDLRRGDHPLLQHPAAYQPSRRDVERRIVGTLCPFQAAITALGQRIDRSSAPAVAMVLP